MTTALLIAALIVALAGHLWLLDRRDRRDREERQTLLQRIQAPQAAVYEHHAGLAPAPEPATGGGMPMSDEEIADMQARRVPDEASELQRIIAQMEAVENGSAQT
jgi:hypothetical protein